MSRSRFQLAPWLLLLPATVLLVAFTHYPAVMTLWKSFYYLPKGSRPARFAGAEHYVSMLRDPVFLASLKNNAIYAAGTVPAPGTTLVGAGDDRVRAVFGFGKRRRLPPLTAPVAH